MTHSNKNIILFLGLLVLFSTSNVVFAQEGPGGVGGNITNRFWYDANDLTGILSDGNAVSVWTNKGGNGSSATQSGSAQPVFRSVAPFLINGYPVISFDGTNDRLVIPNNSDLNTGSAQSTRSFSVVFRTGADINTRQVIYEEGGGLRGLNFYIFNGNVYIGAWNLQNDGAGSPWGFFSVNTAIAANTVYILTMVKNGNSTSTGTITGHLNGQLFGTINNVGLIYAHSGAIGIGAMQGATYFETGSSGGNGHYFTGDIAEFIHYNTAYNTAERVLVENYLSSKYSITLAANDVYSMDIPSNGDYDHEMAGIGQATDGSNNLDGKGSSLVQCNSANDLVNGEFLTWGHDNGALTETTAGTPINVDNRLTRVWKVDESGDVGTVDLYFDVSTISVSGVVASDFRLLIDGTDTDFSDATVISAVSVTSGVIRFSGVNLVAGDHFTLGIQISAIGNTGPGGVGVDQQYRFWYDANDFSGTFSDNDPVGSWTNKGGNGSAAIQTGTARPLFRDQAGVNMNGYPVLQFDGINDRLVIPNNDDLNTGAAQSERTFLLAFRTGNDVSSRQVLFEEGGTVRGLNIYIFNGNLYLGAWNLNNDGTGAPWGFSSINTAISANTSYVVSYVKNGNSTTTGTINGYLNGSSFGSINGVGFIYAHSGAIGIGGMENDTYFESGSANGDGNYFNGVIGEFIHYNYDLEDAPRIIIENYLAAKYGIVLNSNDNYTMDNMANGDYDTDVAGIGQDGNGFAHGDAKGPGMVRVYQPLSLANNRYFIWGHNNATLCGVAEVPNPLTNRLRRVWRVSETADIGTHRISFDLTDVTYGNISNIRLLIDNDGDFSNATVISQSNSFGDVVEFYNVDLNDGDYFTVATSDFFIDNTTASTTWNGASGTGWFNNGNWSDGVPDEFTEAVIPNGLTNYPVVGGAGAVCGGVMIQSGASIEVQGTFDFDVHGSWVNSGTFIENLSTVNFLDGCGSGIVQLSAAQNFYNVTIDKAEGLTNNNHQIRIRGTLTLTNGTFNTGDSLRLISNENGTARIAEITGGSITGDIQMQRHIIEGQTNWRFLTFPVSGAELEQFDDDFLTSGIPGTDYPNWPSISNPWPSIYLYDETQGTTYFDGFYAPSSTSVTLGVGEGAWIWCGDSLGGTAAFTIDVSGPPNTGTLNLPVSYTFAGGAMEDGWNMVANPYPCTIDWDAANWTKTNINNAIYIWNPQNQQYASYVGGVGTNLGSRYIASSQAFWVQANAASPGLTIRESCKVDQEQDFIKPITKEIIRLKLEGAGFSDETVVRFDAQASNGFDPFADAQRFNAYQAPSPRISSISLGEDYSINTLDGLTMQRTIPIKVTTPTSDSCIISATDISAVQGGCLLLEDLYTGEIANMNQGASYSFYLDDTTQAARFLLHVYPSLSGEIVDASCPGLSDGAATVNTTLEGPLTYIWTDFNGDVISETSNSSASSNQLTGIGAGIYKVYVTGEPAACGMLLLDIEIEEPKAWEVSVITENVSCEDCCDGIAELEVSGATPPYDFHWSNNTGHNDTVAYGLCPGQYIIGILDERNCAFEQKVDIGTQTGIGAYNEKQIINVYPNPVSDILFIQSAGSQPSQFRLYNITGQLVLDRLIKDGVGLDISELSDGVYTYELITSETSIKDRLIIKGY